MNPTKAPFRKHIFLFAALLLAVVLGSNLFEESSRVTPIRIGLVRGPSSFCAFGLPENQNPQFELAVENSEDAILFALEGGHLDAALLPSECLDKFDARTFSIIAVTSFLDLTIMESQGRASTIYDIGGRNLALPDALRGSKEVQMLNALLAHANISVEMEFADGDALWRQAQAGDFDLMILPAAQNDAHLRIKANHRTFSLASQWKTSVGTSPPAGSFIVVKRAILEERSVDIHRFLATIKDSIDYINTKRKKAAMFIAAQFGGDPAAVYFALASRKFVYLDGSDMMDSIAELRGIGGVLPQYQSKP